LPADNHVQPGVLAAHVVEQLGAREALDVAAVSDHGLGDRMRAEAGLVEQLVGRGQGVVLFLAVLVQDDLAFALQLGLGEGAVAHDVAEHLHEVLRVACQPGHVESGVVLVGMRVDFGAQPLGIQVDLLAVALVRALESHVLDDVADAVQALALVLAAGAHEHADAGGFEVRQADRDDTHAVVQSAHRGAGIAGVVCHRECNAIKRWRWSLGPRTAKKRAGDGARPTLFAIVARLRDGRSMPLRRRVQPNT
jgi:predicted GNAT family acetyltransferase